MLLIMRQNVFKLQTTVFRKFASQERDYDIIIAGGGLIGSTMALALGKDSLLKNKKILVLEAKNKAEILNYNSDDLTNRVSALSLASQDLLDYLGVWKHIEGNCQKINTVHIWDGCGDALITFHDRGVTQNMAFIAENDLLSTSVIAEINTCPNISINYSTPLTSVKRSMSEGEKVTVFVEGDQSYTCDLLIGADGAESFVREEMGVKYLNWKFDQKLLSANVSLSKKGDMDTIFQKLNPENAIVMMPILHDKFSILWCGSSHKIDKLMKLPEPKFIEELNKEILKKQPCLDRDGVSKIELPLLMELPPETRHLIKNSIKIFPVDVGHCTRNVASGIALIGSAAHEVHPTAGKGVNMGYRDVTHLAQIIIEQVYKKNPISSFDMLLKYEKWCKMYYDDMRVPMGIFINHKLYGTELTPRVWLRGIGSRLSHDVKTVRNIMFKHFGWKKL